MNRIAVDTDKYISIAKALKVLSRNLVDPLISLDRVINTLPEIANKKEYFKEELKKQSRKTGEAQDRIELLEAGVLQAAGLFDLCEKQIIESVNTVTGKAGASMHGSGAGSPWQSKWLSGLDMVLDLLGIDKYGRDYKDPGTERQAVQDYLLQERLSGIFRLSGLDKAAWDKADMDGKKKILNQIIDRINQILGTKITKDVIIFPNTKEKRNTKGYYSPGAHTININKDFMKNYSYEEVMETLVHEMRHAYQDDVISQPGDFIVSEENAKSWDNNSSNYIDGNKDFHKYRAQPVERDARTFAGGVEYTS